MQTTLKKSVGFIGTGLHTGRPVRMIVRPAPANHGIVFFRTDVRGVDPRLPARWDLVDRTPLCTRLRNDDNVSVSTIEHLMAAFAGLGLRNAHVDIDGPEVPILDGSAAPFVRKFLDAGLESQNGAAMAVQILRPVEVRSGDSVARLEPAEGLHIDFEIDFDEKAIGRQRRSLNMRNGAFVRTLCDSRTFCRQSDVDAMRAQGLALGGTEDNAVVVDANSVVSQGGLRHADEPVRHKMLDALGDLALAGAPVLGRYTGLRAGHSLTNSLLRALFADPTAYRMVECDDATAQELPGVGVGQRDLALCA